MTRAELELRRLAAVPDLQSSISLAEIARRHRISRMTAFRWRQQVKDGGSLAARRAPRRPRSMNQSQEALCVALYAVRPRTCGFDVDRWTQKTFCQAIQKAFGLEYSEDHVGVILDRLGLRKRKRHTI